MSGAPNDGGDADAVDRPARRPRLPDVALPPAGAGAPANAAPTPIREPRRAAVLVLLDAAAPADAAARDYLDALAAAGETIAGWDGRVLVVVAGEGDAAARSLAPLALPFPVLADRAGRVGAAAGVAPPALVVADQWGEVHAAHAVHAAGGPAGWLAPAEVERWLRYLAIRCAG